MVRKISEIATQQLLTDCMVDNVPMDGNSGHTDDLVL